jgi:hypothetical protein
MPVGPCERWETRAGRRTGAFSGNAWTYAPKPDHARTFRSAHVFGHTVVNTRRISSDAEVCVEAWGRVLIKVLGG